MKNINLENLKSIFWKKEVESQPEQDLQEDLDNPYLSYSIVIRGVSELELLDEIYMNKSPREYSLVRDRVKVQQFDFLYEFLKKVPLQDDKEIVEFILKDLGRDEVIGNLNKLITHFIELEEYEKCFNIQKYLQKVEKKLDLPVDL